MFLRQAWISAISPVLPLAKRPWKNEFIQTWTILAFSATLGRGDGEGATSPGGGDRSFAQGRSDPRAVLPGLQFDMLGLLRAMPGSRSH
jgi:hypothetical protein